MNNDDSPQNRQSRRSHVLMAASIESAGVTVSVKLRNLSSEGALVEGGGLPPVGSAVTFRKKELDLAGRVAWVTDRRGGIKFDAKLDPEAVLRHVPASRPAAKLDFRRPPLKTRTLSPGERQIAQDWIWGDPLQNLGE